MMRKDQPVDDAVNAAIEAVDAQRYMLGAGGAPLPQTTRPELIARVLRLLDPQPRHRVLDVGTGSGYSGTPGACRGDQGLVVSLDVDPTMAGRAERLFRDDSYNNVQVLLADGQRGYPGRAAYDRQVAWAAAADIPSVWVEQVRPSGIIAAPVVRPHPVGARLRVLPYGQTIEEAAIPAGFIPLTPKPYRPWETSKHGRPQPP